MSDDAMLSEVVGEVLEASGWPDGPPLWAYQFASAIVEVVAVVEEREGETAGVEANDLLLRIWHALRGRPQQELASALCDELRELIEVEMIFRPLGVGS